VLPAFATKERNEVAERDILSVNPLSANSPRKSDARTLRGTCEKGSDI
jgi:hypothetical protein